MKKLLILLLLISVALPLVNAADFTMQLGNDELFSVSCDVDGAPCSSLTTSCNFSLRDPDNVLLVNAAPMTIASNGDATYQINGTTNLTSYGDYTARVSCADGVLSSTQTYIIEVNPTGDNRDLSLFIILAVAAILVTGLAIWAQNEYIGFFGGAIFIGTGIYALIYGIGNLTNLYTEIIAYVSMGIGFILFIAAGYKVADQNGGSYSSE